MLTQARKIKMVLVEGAATDCFSFRSCNLWSESSGDDHLLEL